MADTSPLKPSERSAWRAFIDMHHRLERHLAQHLQRDFGISAADFEVLIHLSNAPDGYLSLSDLGRATHWEKSRLSHHLQRMQQRGLISRRDSPGRGWDAHITADGRALMARAAPEDGERIRELFVAPLGPEGLRSIAAHAATVMAALDEHAATHCPLGTRAPEPPSSRPGPD